MKPIIFIRIADMKYYKGITKFDTPENGGAYVKETGFAHECNNFAPVIQDGEDYEKCIGFFRMLGGNGAHQLHIEKIPGCELLSKSEQCEGVTVVFVSKANNSKTMRVVGFYKDAIVYRYPHCMYFENEDEQEYMFEAKKENCVVLPKTTRHGDSRWYVPNSSSKNNKFGFGRANVWYAGGKGASKDEIEYVEKMIQSIEEYDGDNWMDKGGER